MPLRQHLSVCCDAAGHRGLTAAARLSILPAGYPGRIEY
jgi:hypothetical protein